MRHVAEKANVDLETIYQHIAWPLYKKYGHCYDAFKIAVAEPDKVLDLVALAKPEDREGNLLADERVRRELLNNIRRRLTPQPVKIRAGR